MDFVPHMPYMTVQIIAPGKGSVCPTSAFVGDDGGDPIVVLTFALVDVQAMDIVKEIDVNAKKGMVTVNF